jgi:predicted nucleic acid-binding protein
MGSPVSEPPRVYLDANVFITAMETPGARSDHAWWIIRSVEEGDIAGMTSEITLAEVLVKPMQMGNAELVAAYQEMIMPGARFDVLPVSRDILVGAAGLRARRTSIRLPDAIHIASALTASCRFMVTDDRQLHSVEDVKVLGLTPFTLDDILAEPK